MANGNSSKNPPRLRQKIRVRIGIALNAITGPDVPIPIITRVNSPISRLDGKVA
jgi:hypothetical protein